jgi:hypothetical protein
MSDAAAHAAWTLARSRTGFFGDGSFLTTGQQDVAPRRSHTEAPRR